MLFIAFSFVIQAILFVQVISARKKILLNYGSETNASLLLQYHSLLSARRKKQNYISYWIYYFFHHGPLLIPFPKLRENMEFKIIQQFFIFTYNLPYEFNYANYTCETLKHYIISLVHVRPVNWLILSGLVGLNYARIGLTRGYEDELCQHSKGYTASSHAIMADASSSSGSSTTTHAYGCEDFIVRYAFVCICGISVVLLALLYTSEVYYQRLVDIVLDHEEFLQYQNPVNYDHLSNSSLPMKQRMANQSNKHYNSTDDTFGDSPSRPSHRHGRQYGRSDSFRSMSSIDEVLSRKHHLMNHNNPNQHRRQSRDKKSVTFSSPEIPPKGQSNADDEKSLEEHFDAIESNQFPSEGPIDTLMPTINEETSSNQELSGRFEAVLRVNEDGVEELNLKEEDLRNTDSTIRPSSLDDFTSRRDSFTSNRSELTYESLNDWRKARRRGSKDYFIDGSGIRRQFFRRRSSMGSVHSVMSVASIVVLVNSIIKKISPSTDRRYLYAKSLERIWLVEQAHVQNLRQLVDEREKRPLSASFIGNQQENIPQTRRNSIVRDYPNGLSSKAYLIDGHAMRPSSRASSIANNSTDHSQMIQNIVPFMDQSVRSQDRRKTHQLDNDSSDAIDSKGLSPLELFEARKKHSNSLSVSYSTYFEVAESSNKGFGADTSIPLYLVQMRQKSVIQNRYKYLQSLRRVVIFILRVFYMVLSTIAYVMLMLCIFLYRSLMAHDSQGSHDDSYELNENKSIGEVTDEACNYIESTIKQGWVYTVRLFNRMAKSSYRPVSQSNGLISADNLSGVTSVKESTSINDSSKESPSRNHLNKKIRQDIRTSLTGRAIQTVRNSLDPNLKAEFHSIFLFHSPNLYYQTIELILLLQCFYVALWATDLAKLSMKSESIILWEILLCVPILINFIMLRMILSTSSFIQSISDSNHQIVNSICEEAIDVRNITLRLRKIVRKSLSNITGSRQSQIRYDYLYDLFQSIVNIDKYSEASDRDSLTKSERSTRSQSIITLSMIHDAFMSMIESISQTFTPQDDLNQDSYDPDASGRASSSSHPSQYSEIPTPTSKYSAKSIRKYFKKSNEGITVKQFNALLQILQIRLTDKSTVKIFHIIDKSTQGIISWNDLSAVIFPEMHQKLNYNKSQKTKFNSSPRNSSNHSQHSFQDKEINRNLNYNFKNQTKPRPVSAAYGREGGLQFHSMTESPALHLSLKLNQKSDPRKLFRHNSWDPSLSQSNEFKEREFLRDLKISKGIKQDSMKKLFPSIDDVEKQETQPYRAASPIQYDAISLDMNIVMDSRRKSSIQDSNSDIDSSYESDDSIKENNIIQEHLEDSIQYEEAYEDEVTSYSYTSPLSPSRIDPSSKFQSHGQTFVDV